MADDRMHGSGADGDDGRLPFDDHGEEGFGWEAGRPPRGPFEQPAGSRDAGAGGDPFAWDDSARAPRSGRERPGRGDGRPPDEAGRRAGISDATRHFADDGLDDEWDQWLDPGEGAQAQAPAAHDRSRPEVPTAGSELPDPAGWAPAATAGRDLRDYSAVEPDFGELAPGQHRPERRPPARRGAGPARSKAPRRRRASAGAALAAMLLGFFVCGLFDARNIEHDVSVKPLGTWRTIELDLLKPMTFVSGALRLDAPANAITGWLGRGEGDHHTLAELKTKGKSKWPRRITKAHPLRLYIAGDSMAQSFGAAMRNLAQGTGVMKAKAEYKVSSGLTRRDFYDWPQHFIDQLVEYNPDGTVVLFGANDGQDVSDNGKTLKVFTPEWSAWYAKRVGETMKILTRGGRRVYWVGLPIMHDPVYKKKIAMENGIYEAEAKKHPGVTYISTWDLFADAQGRWAEYLPDASGKMVAMRTAEKVHLTSAGADRMAKAVLDVVKKDWSIPAQP